MLFVKKVMGFVAVSAVSLGLMVGVGAAPAWAAGCGPFTDVSASDPRCADLTSMVADGVVDAAGTKFRPKAAATRADLARVAYGLANPGKSVPACKAKPFTDVKKTRKDCGAIAWAADHKVMSGHAKKAFKPGTKVAKAQVATTLFKVLKPGKAAPKCTAKPFKDVKKKGQLCRAVRWLTESSAMKGAGKGRFGTAKKVTRIDLVHAAWTARTSGPALPKAPTKLVGTYFESVGYVDFYSSDNNYFGVVFLNNTWAYWGRPESGMPTCTKKTAAPNIDLPQDGWGCIKYTYNAKTGVVKLGKLSGKYRADGTLKLTGTYREDGQSKTGTRVFNPTVIPLPGTTLNADLVNQGYIGMCSWYCTTWTSHLILGADGKFVLTESSVSSMTGGGSYTWVGNFPEDEYGTYTIKSKGRLVLKFANGTTDTKTIAVMVNKKGKPVVNGAPGAGGLIVGRVDYNTSDS